MNAYLEMQKKLGKPERGEGIEKENKNLKCIFHNFNRKPVYKEEGNYLCKFPYHLFTERIKNIMDMVFLIK